MANVFDKAVQIAQERQTWEAKINPEKDAFVLRGLSEKELNESQKQIDGFHAAMIKAAKDGKFQSKEQVKSALDALDYEKEWMPLWRLAEMCMPVQAETQLIAEVLAPARLGTVNRIREGKFGIYDVAPESEGVVIHHAVDRSGDGEARPKTGTAKEMAEARLVEQGKAFDELSGAMGVAMKSTPGKSIEAARAALDKLSGVRMVEGERQDVASKAKGQMKLFGEDLAPTPPVAKKKPKAGK